MRVRINNLQGFSPINYSNVGPDSQNVRSTLGPVDRDEANVEAEKGETVALPNMSFYKIGGEKHYNGGTPLNLPPNSFIFSDAKEQRITGDVLTLFNKNPKDKLTPAEISKQYDLNKYLAKLQDSTADHYDFTTSELMIKNNLAKLRQLAMLQEANKGFPEGVPNIGLPEAKKGGNFDDTDPHKGDKKKSKNPKTGELSSTWNAMTAYPTIEDYAAAVGYTGKINPKDPKGSARKIQRYVMDNYPEIVEEEHKSWGMPNAGRPDDGYLGVRWQDIARRIAAPRPASVPAPGRAQFNSPTIPSTPPTPYTFNTPTVNLGLPPIGTGNPGDMSQSQLNFKLGLNQLQTMDVGNTLFDLTTVRRGHPTRYQNYGLDQAQGMAANVKPYDYQAAINEASKGAAAAYRANQALGTNAAATGANNAAVYGKLLEGVSNIRNQEYNANAQLYTQNQATLAGYASSIGQDRMQNAMAYNDRVEALNDNFQKETTYLKNLALSRINQYMAQNQGMLYDNMLHPQYTFDPTKGFAGTASFNPRSNPFNFTNSPSSSEGTDLARITKTLMGLGLKQPQAAQQALQILRSRNLTDDKAVGSTTYATPGITE